MWWTGELGLRQGQVKGVAEVRQQAAKSVAPPTPPRRSIRLTDQRRRPFSSLARGSFDCGRGNDGNSLLDSLPRSSSLYSTLPHQRTSGRHCPPPSRARGAGKGGHHRRKWRRCLRHGKWASGTVVQGGREGGTAFTPTCTLGLLWNVRWGTTGEGK